VTRAGRTACCRTAAICASGIPILTRRDLDYWRGRLPRHRQGRRATMVSRPASGRLVLVQCPLHTNDHPSSAGVVAFCSAPARELLKGPRHAGATLHRKKSRSARRCKTRPRRRHAHDRLLRSPRIYSLPPCLPRRCRRQGVVSESVRRRPNAFLDPLCNSSGGGCWRLTARARWAADDENPADGLAIRQRVS
jgi:hypothetical protein